MKKERKEMEKALLNFVKRVSEGNTTMEAEVQVLPQVVQALILIRELNW